MAKKLNELCFENTTALDVSSYGRLYFPKYLFCDRLGWFFGSSGLLYKKITRVYYEVQVNT